MNWIDIVIYLGKPKVSWVESYMRGTGAIVESYCRTEANEITTDSIDTDMDNDGISGIFNTDRDGDEMVDSAIETRFG